jgi:hypothetical protein
LGSQADCLEKRLQIVFGIAVISEPQLRLKIQAHLDVRILYFEVL